MRNNSLLCAVLASGLGSHLFAQTPDPHTFEVASIKRDASGPMAPQRVNLQEVGRVSIVNVNALTLVQIAYGLNAEQVIGAPNWMRDERFDVNATADARSTQDDRRTMLRALLIDRFKLVAHQEAREASGYALVPTRTDGRLGPALRPAAKSCETIRAEAGKLSGPGSGLLCGLPTFANGIITGSVSVQGFSIADVAALASRETHERVVDKTGLAGAYDWDLKWTPQAFVESGADRARFPQVDPDGPSFLTALQEQLGLKLVRVNDTQPVLVIDHVERPTED